MAVILGLEDSFFLSGWRFVLLRCQKKRMDIERHEEVIYEEIDGMSKCGRAFLN